MRHGSKLQEYSATLAAPEEIKFSSAAKATGLDDEPLLQKLFNLGMSKARGRSSG